MPFSLSYTITIFFKNALENNSFKPEMIVKFIIQKAAYIFEIQLTTRLYLLLTFSLLNVVYGIEIETEFQGFVSNFEVVNNFSRVPTSTKTFQSSQISSQQQEGRATLMETFQKNLLNEQLKICKKESHVHVQTKNTNSWIFSNFSMIINEYSIFTYHIHRSEIKLKTEKVIFPGWTRFVHPWTGWESRQ